jgi:hypothetical protein
MPGPCHVAPDKQKDNHKAHKSAAGRAGSGRSPPTRGFFVVGGEHWWESWEIVVSEIRGLGIGVFKSVLRTFSQYSGLELGLIQPA